MKKQFIIHTENYVVPDRYECKQVFVRQWGHENEVEFISAPWRYTEASSYYDVLPVCQWTIKPKYPAEMLDALQELRNAWMNVMQQWDALDNDELEMELVKNYPFNQSFDEMYCGVNDWVNTFVPGMWNKTIRESSSI